MSATRRGRGRSGRPPAKPEGTMAQRKAEHAQRAAHRPMELPMDRKGNAVAVGDEVVLTRGPVSTLTYVGGVGYGCVFVPSERRSVGWQRVDADQVEVTGR